MAVLCWKSPNCLTACNEITDSFLNSPNSHPLKQYGFKSIIHLCLGTYSFTMTFTPSFRRWVARSRMNCSPTPGSFRNSARTWAGQRWIRSGSKHANMKELRFDCAGGVWRVAFAFDTERAAILLVGGNKGGADQRRFYKKLIASADVRFDGHLAALKAASVSKQVKEKNHGKKSK